MAIFLTADLHLGDEYIIKFENRPFRDAQKMNEQLIKNWNHTVNEKDEVWVLGDLVGNADYSLHPLKDIVSQLNGTKYLILGNHDKKDTQFYRHAGFKEVYDHPVLLQDFFLLSHEPKYMNENTPFINIFGHVHNNPVYNTISKTGYCVCIERTDYRPIALTNIIEHIKCHIPTYDKETYMSMQLKHGANKSVIEFIYEFLMHQDLDKCETIRYQFRAGYCYHFAHMLKATFKRGTVCWAAPFGHFVWKDEDNTPYDVEGIYQGECDVLIPEYYLGVAIQDFLHIPNLEFNATPNEIQEIMDKYEEDQKLWQANMQK